MLHRKTPGLIIAIALTLAGGASVGQGAAPRGGGDVSGGGGDVSGGAREQVTEASNHTDQAVLGAMEREGGIKSLWWNALDGPWPMRNGFQGLREGRAVEPKQSETGGGKEDVQANCYEPYEKPVLEVEPRVVAASSTRDLWMVCVRRR